MTELYPLQFKPIFRRYLWGGRRLESVLGKNLPPGSDYAESWEIVDRDADQSMVINGPWAGQSLGELVRQRGPELLGRHAPAERFPLLLKWLDAQKTLSVQVHPDDARAARLSPPDFGKTEAWVVVAREPGSVIYAGLKRGFDRAALEREIARGTTSLCLHQFEPEVGDCVFVPAGMVHAIGAGLVVAEIQQASDTTYRLDDFGRRGPDGQPRPLHIEPALEAIDYGLGPGGPQTPAATDRPHIERLVQCDKFVLDRWRLDTVEQAGGDQRFHLIAVVDGAVQLIGGGVEPLTLTTGQTVLVPAACGAVELQPQRPTQLLDIYLP